MIAKSLSNEYLFKLRHHYLEPYWKVMLNNDEIVYQDDYLESSSAWRRLQAYCKNNNLYPIHMMLEYGDNTLNVLPPYQDGYFFKRGILSEMICESNGDGSTTSFQGNRSKTFIIGYLKDNTIYTHTVKIPELAIWDSDARKIEDIYLEEQSLFLVNKCQNTQANTQIG